VITPEGCASILWRDGSRASDAADQLKLLAPNALALGVVDRIVQEPSGGAHCDPDAAASSLGAHLREELAELRERGADELRSARYEKFRSMGSISEIPSQETE